MTKPKPPVVEESQLATVFLFQILSQCQYVILAHESLIAAVEATDLYSAGRAFFALQNMLTAAANISKALWGQQASRSKERKFLRELIGVSESSTFRDVTMRNNFEHFDERIEKWWRKSKNHSPIDCSLISSDSIIDNSDPINWFRVYEPETSRLFFWGQEFDIEALIKEARTMLPTLERKFRERLHAEFLETHPAMANRIRQDEEIAAAIEALFDDKPE